jgi:NADH:ubiquinone oxidoreductase subunit C
MIPDHDLVMQDRLKGDTPEARNMRQYIEEVRDRVSQAQALKFVIMFEEALDEMEEANEYSKARYMNFPLEKNNVFFTIEIMIDILSYSVDDPEIAIRCRNKRTNDVIFLWSFEKFRERLALM